MRYIIMTGLLIIALSSTSYAEKMYVGNIIKVTLRTGPGTDHKVVQMLQSGNEVEVLEPGGDWSHVRAHSGNEGWILSRFISSNMPSDLQLEILQQKHEKLLATADVLKAENTKFSDENQILTTELASTKESLNQVSNRYNSLKKESADFLKLQSKYEKVTLALSNQTRRAIELNELLLQRNIKLGLLGAGVLFFGFIIGFSTRKQRRRSSLLG